MISLTTAVSYKNRVINIELRRFYTLSVVKYSSNTGHRTWVLIIIKNKCSVRRKFVVGKHPSRYFSRESGIVYALKTAPVRCDNNILSMSKWRDET